MKFTKTIILLSASAITISACGGGGGGSSSPSTAPTTTAPTTPPTSTPPTTPPTTPPKTDPEPAPETEPTPEPKNPFDNPRTVSTHSQANFQDTVYVTSNCATSTFAICDSDFKATREGQIVTESLTHYSGTDTTTRNRRVNGAYVFSSDYARFGSNVGDEWYIGGAFFDSNGSKGTIYGVANKNDLSELLGLEPNASAVSTNPASKWTWTNISSKVGVAADEINGITSNLLPIVNNTGTITYDTQSGNWNANLQDGEITLDGTMEGHNVGGTATFSVDGTTYATGNFGGADGLVDGTPQTGGAFAGQNEQGTIFFGGIWESDENSTYTPN